MIVRENVSLASLTTLRVGGVARYVYECHTDEDVVAAIAFAAEKQLPWRVLGEGSNVLASDAGFLGVVLLMRTQSIMETVNGTDHIYSVDAGVRWDEFVEMMATKHLWGVENLAGIPGTVGASPVQNIGAYGTEVKETITAVRVFDTQTNTIKTFSNAECAFAYRHSRFKEEPHLIILNVSFQLRRDGVPHVEYKDLQRYRDEGGSLATPLEIAAAVRTIRSKKFPDLKVWGTAGSFFKNPIIPEETYKALLATYPDFPGYKLSDGIKIPIAFVLDHILNLRGYQKGKVQVYKNHALVIVTEPGATATEVNLFADSIATMVREQTNILIEREVRTFP